MSTLKGRPPIGYTAQVKLLDAAGAYTIYSFNPDDAARSDQVAIDTGEFVSNHGGFVQRSRLVRRIAP